MNTIPIITNHFSLSIGKIICLTLTLTYVSNNQEKI